jgi:hypothetical protein
MMARTTDQLASPGRSCSAPPPPIAMPESPYVPASIGACSEILVYTIIAVIEHARMEVAT